VKNSVCFRFLVRLFYLIRFRKACKLVLKLLVDWWLDKLRTSLVS